MIELKEVLIIVFGSLLPLIALPLIFWAFYGSKELAMKEMKEEFESGRLYRVCFLFFVIMCTGVALSKLT